MQRTALAISAVSAETLETRGIESAGKLTGIAPNLTTSSGSGSSSHLIINVRGIGDAEPVLIDHTSSLEKVQGHAQTLEADLGDSLTVRSITGFRKWSSDLQNTDLDGNEGLKGVLLNGDVGDVSLFGADNRRRQEQCRKKST